MSVIPRMRQSHPTLVSPIASSRHAKILTSRRKVSGDILKGCSGSRMCQQSVEKLTGLGKVLLVEETGYATWCVYRNSWVEFRLNMR